MELFTKIQYEQLIENGRAQDGTKDFDPVVKLFTPDANCTWLISEIDPENSDIAFGLCDLGMGFPEMGSVSISEITAIRGQLHLPVERDRSFQAIAPLTTYWKASNKHQRIVESPTIIQEILNEDQRQKESKLQRKLGDFVEREIIRNASILVSHHIETDVERMMEFFPDLLDHFDEDGEPVEIYEYWIVSQWLADKLKEYGEVVENDFHGLTIWGRTTTGQAIMMDSVIREIYLKYRN